MKYLFLVLFITSLAFSEDAAPKPAPLSQSAERAITAYDTKVIRAKTDYLIAVRAEQEKLAVILHKEMDTLTKKGDLDGAMAIKNRIMEISKSVPELNAEDPFGKPAAVTDELIITKAQYGAGDNWVDIGNYLRKKVKDGKIDFTLNPTNDDAIRREPTGDPAFGVHKRVRIEYRKNGVAGKMEIGEGETIKL